MLPSSMTELTLEIVEGAGVGDRVVVDRPIVIGRAPDVDLLLQDEQVSRHHARVSPAEDGSAVVEDLGSVNGTFVNQNELQGPARLDPADELLVGVTLIEVRSHAQVTERPTAARAVPPALARAPGQPDFVKLNAIDVADGVASKSPGARELNKFLDVRVRRRAQLAPLALLMLIALALSIYFATR
jgi:pSer/pThr/pTyr-binding forkhead associated (FHA) protein